MTVLGIRLGQGVQRRSDIIDDAKKGNLPAYSFIEPRYFAALGLGMPNDRHPPHDVVFTEQLIATIYNALRTSPLWESSLLVVIYDEHGGCFDHAPPPLAVSPGDHHPNDAFAFDRYGVRVPAVIVSPYIQAGTILRSASGGVPHRGPPYPYDHTSIIATLRKCFNLGGPMTARDAAAPDLDSVLNLDEPTNNQLGTITVSAYQPSQQDLEDAIGRPLTHMQQALHELSAVLPPPGVDVEAYIAKLASGIVPIAPIVQTASEARNFISQQLGKIL